MKTSTNKGAVMIMEPMTEEELARLLGVPWRRRRYAVGGGDRARAVIAEHPDWTLQQVADAAGVSIGTAHNARHQPNREERS